MRPMIKGAAAFGIAILIAGTVVAQERKHTPTPERHEAMSDLKERIVTWARSSVLPTARTWKARLDGAMTSDDLQTLNGLRARATALRGRAKEIMSAMHTAWEKEDYATVKSSRAKMKELGAERKKLMEDLKPLAVEYRSTLEAIGADAKPSIETWKGEAMKIVESWMTENKDKLGKGGGMKHLRHLGREWLGKLGGGRHKHAAVAYFMLWNGDDFTELDELMTPPGDNPDLR